MNYIQGHLFKHSRSLITYTNGLHSQVSRMTMHIQRMGYTHHTPWPQCGRLGARSTVQPATARSFVRILTVLNQLLCHIKLYHVRSVVYNVESGLGTLRKHSGLRDTCANIQSSANYGVGLTLVSASSCSGLRSP